MRDPIRDLVRGINVFEMLTVNLSSNPIFDHSEVGDKFITYADTVFPTFAFLSGMSPMPLKRGVELIGLGMTCNLLMTLQSRKFKLRYVAALQRMGLSSLIVNGFGYTPSFPLSATAIWTALTVVGADDPRDPLAKPEGTSQTKIDDVIMGRHTLYRPDYDPEGILGSFGTALSMYAGFYFIRNFAGYTALEQAGVGALTAVGGLALAKLFPKIYPLSKIWWTPSFVLFTSGYAISKYAAVRLIQPFLPGLVRYGLICLGRKTSEIYLTDIVIHTILGATGVSAKVKSWLSKYLGATAADLSFVFASNCFMIYLASVYEEKGIRLRIFK